MPSRRYPVVALDFDGTLCEHAYPDIGDPVGAFAALGRIKQAYPDVRFILWTMRSGETLAAAVQHCKEQGLEFWGVNENPTQKGWSESPKAYAHVYVDDAALSASLLTPNDGRRPYLDWHASERHLTAFLSAFYEES